MKESEQGATRAFDASNAPPPGPGREPSREEAEGMKDTETRPKAPLGVGESLSARAEDIAREAEEERGSDREGTKGAGRPYGSGDSHDADGVEPNPSVTPGSPDLGPGDQGS
ncbi:hypothetical protein ACQPX6_14230 [Actinomycetospora sp. CA-101289]|uniref:hypothetical protein n=1 Tax=Actinomycetospora sp. CA-101289 TaxID=3239893 RepID=UPI003D98345B